MANDQLTGMRSYCESDAAAWLAAWIREEIESHRDSLEHADSELIRGRISALRDVLDLPNKALKAAQDQVKRGE